MRHQIVIVGFIAVSALGACNKAEETPAPVAATTESAATPGETMPTPADVAAWAGKWTGPEGLYVNIAPGTDGKIALEMQSDLDTNGSYEGTAIANGISFKRGEATLTLKKATGDETGLKYLAGKKDCVMVKSGEGYCRD